MRQLRIGNTRQLFRKQVIAAVCAGCSHIAAVANTCPYHNVNVRVLKLVQATTANKLLFKFIDLQSNVKF